MDIWVIWKGVRFLCVVERNGLLSGRALRMGLDASISKITDDIYTSTVKYCSKLVQTNSRAR